MRYLAFLILLITTSHSNEWEVVYYLDLFPQTIEAVDSNNVYIMTGNGSYTNVYKSTNRGITWKNIPNTFNDMGDCESFSVTDSNTFFALFNDDRQRIIYYTVDGGKTIEKKTIDHYWGMRTIDMYDENTGVINGGQFITFDNWESYETFNIKEFTPSSYNNTEILNDSTIYTCIYEVNNALSIGHFLKLNLKSQEYELHNMTEMDVNVRDLCVVNEDLIFACGKGNGISGGSGHDVVYKSTDEGKTWRMVLDFYSDNSKGMNGNMSPFGLQQLDFKDSLTGVAVGQFSKILYTYDGGESWIYEDKLPQALIDENSPTMKVRYVGDIPIITIMGGGVLRLKEEDLKPTEEHKYSLSGRVWDGERGIPSVAVTLNGNRVTMTDEDGYYTFTNLKKDNYNIRAINKYFDGGNPAYYFEPYLFSPDPNIVDLESDTTEIDFLAGDVRWIFSISGRIVDNDGNGVAGIELIANDSTTITDEEGYYVFEGMYEGKYNGVRPITDFGKDYVYHPQYYRFQLNVNAENINFTNIYKPESDEYFKVSGRVTDENGNGIENQSLRIQWDTTKTDSEGYYVSEYYRNDRPIGVRFIEELEDSFFVEPEFYSISSETDSNGLNFLIRKVGTSVEAPAQANYFLPSISRDEINITDEETLLNLESYAIYDLRGQLLQSDTHQAGTLQIPTGTLPKGIYLLKLNYRNGTFRTHKFMKE